MPGQLPPVLGIFGGTWGGWLGHGWPVGGIFAKAFLVAYFAVPQGAHTPL